MKHIGVAALAEHRLLHDQQRLMGGAVRVVAVETTLTDGRVLPQEGAALFAVTLVTLVIDRVCRNEPLSLGAMRIMAVGALDQSFVHTMVEGHIELRLLLQMARIAKLRLGFDEQKLCFFRVVWGISANTRRVVSLEEGFAIGYEPQDDAEVFASELLALKPKEETDFIGGPYTGKDRT